jgi:hypothetical protein
LSLTRILAAQRPAAEISEPYGPAVARAGLAGLRFHDLRHTAATLAAAAGATTKELMERLGYATPAMALRYQHVLAERQALLAAALDRLAAQALAAGEASGGQLELAPPRSLSRLQGTRRARPIEQGTARLKNIAADQRKRESG